MSRLTCDMTSVLSLLAASTRSALVEAVTMSGVRMVWAVAGELLQVKNFVPSWLGFPASLTLSQDREKPAPPQTWTRMHTSPFSPHDTVSYVTRLRADEACLWRVVAPRLVAMVVAVVV